jgi:hypothetical protein
MGLNFEGLLWLAREGEWEKNPAVSPTLPLAHDLLMLIRENPS